MIPPRKILVVALDNLGDAVMASAVLGPIKQLFPQVRTGLWVKSYVGGLFMDHSQIDMLHASDPFWDKSPGRGKGSIGNFMMTLVGIRRQKYDAAIILNSEWRRSLACMLAGIPVRVGYRRRQSTPFLTASFATPPLQHFVDDHRQLLEQWAQVSISSHDCMPRLELTQADEQEWNAWSKETGYQRRAYAVMHLFSGDENKNWPLSCWAELIEARLAKNPAERFVLLCGPGEEPKLGTFRSRLLRNETVLLSAPSLARLKAVIGNARFVVGGDSGPGHVAAALGTPILSLFGSTDPVRSRPVGRNITGFLEKSPIRDLPLTNVLDMMREL